MSAGHVARVALFAAVLVACGERAGDPVVALSGDAARAGSSGVDSNGSGAEGGATNGDGPTGLCGPCATSLDCGDANDACIRRQDSGFCGRDCDDQRRCPDGYDCVGLNDDRLRQCVPRAGCREPPNEPPPLDDARRYLLSLINTERALFERPPLDSSPCLDELAQSSALDFARTDEPLGKFVKECDPVWPACSCGWSAEAEVALAAYALDWQSAVTRAFIDPDERVARAFLSGDVTAVGIGFWLSGDELWIALSFG